MEKRHQCARATAATFGIDPAILSNARSPGVPRRVASALYDLLLLGGVLFIAAAVATALAQGFFGVDLTHGLAQHLFQLYLVGVCALYYLYFWTQGRQSLGMRVWRLRLVRDDGQHLSWNDALRRLVVSVICVAPAGLGLWWIWFDKDRLSWHDRLSKTRLVILTKPSRRRGSASGQSATGSAASS